MARMLTQRNVEKNAYWDGELRLSHWEYEEWFLRPPAGFEGRLDELACLIFWCWLIR
jgi:hypothetical protein